MYNRPAPYENPAVVLDEGYDQHWMRELGNPESRFIYHGPLARLEEMR
jgi:hypothetical protein